MYCIYVELDKNDHNFKYCSVIRKKWCLDIQCSCSTASESAPLQFLAPYWLCNGEYFVIAVSSIDVYDDLLNMLLPTPNVFIITSTPGREAYPEIFFIFTHDY
jgi:F0F1-type ATP synthase alpha subunit